MRDLRLRLNPLTITSSIDGRQLLRLSAQELHGGMVYGLVGKNLSGRSALLRLIGGGLLSQMPLAPGEVLGTLQHIDGAETLEPSRHSVYVDQSPRRSISGLTATVTEELDMHAGLCADSRRIEHDIDLKELADAFYLHRCHSQCPLDLSGGQTAAVALSSALLLARAIFCVDETLAQLDHELRVTAWELLRRFARSGGIVLVADNQYDLMAKFADQVLILDETNLIACEPTETGFRREDVLTKATVPVTTRLARALGIPNIKLPVHYGTLRDELVSEHPLAEPESADEMLDQSKWTMRIEDLTFSYSRAASPVLQEFCVTCPGGRVIALLGRNGAGKSTLCKILNGLLPSKGSLTIGNKVVSPYEEPGRYVSYSFQDPDTQLFLPTVHDEIAFGPRQLGMTQKETEDAVAHVLDRFDLASLASKHPLDLPYALRKRVALASVFAVRRPWTVLDEPTIGQDPRFCEHLHHLVMEARAAGLGFLVISHDAEFVLELCDWVIVLDAGNVAWSGSAAAYAGSANSAQAVLANIPMRLSMDLSWPIVRPTRSELVARFQQTGSLKPAPPFEDH